MELYIGDKVVNFDKNKFEKLGEGQTSITYRNGDEVIKWFKKTEDEVFYRYFVDCKLKLKVISTPSNLIYNKENDFVGVTSNHVDGLKKFKNYYMLILMMHKNEFMENLYTLEEDISILNKYNIVADDLSVINSIFNNGKLYHIDYGNFYRWKKSSIKNKEVFDDYIFDLLHCLSKMEQLSIVNWMLGKNLLKFIDKNMNESETIKQFIKRYQ